MSKGFYQVCSKERLIDFYRFESPTDPPPNLSLLGTAGSRRTVYLGEENKAAEEASTSNGNGKSESPKSSAAPTFLMYNKITTTIAGKESPTPSVSNGTNGNENQKTKTDKKKTDQKNRENAIWYEYGCV